MVTYLPSTAQTTITVSEIEYATHLTISAPTSVAKQTPFKVSGKLTFREAGRDYPLQGRTIELSYNGVSLGTATTGSDGTYSKSVTIPDVGTYTIKARYAGESGLTPAQALSRLDIVAAVPIKGLISLLLGSSLIYYSMR